MPLPSPGRSLAGFALIALVLVSAPPPASAAPAGSMPDNCDLSLDQCFQYGLATTHFIVFYNTTGRFAVTSAWAQNISAMAETAYTKLVDQEGFVPPARNPLPIYLDLAKGGYTSFTTCEDCPPPVGGLQNLQIEYRYKSPCPVDCGIPTSNWELAHEVFGTIEFSTFRGPLPYGSWLSESSANWAGYTVTGNESRWDPWAVSGWLGPNGTTDAPFLQRTFDNAFFWVFLSEHYGGAEIIKRIILGANLTNANDDISSQLRSLGYKESLPQVMDDFAAAILTGNFTDSDGRAAVLAGLPPLAATSTWTGANQTISEFTAGVNDFRTGDPLQVHSPYGFELVQLRPSSNTTISIGLRAQNASCFTSKVVAKQGANFLTYQVPQSAPLTLTAPGRYDDLFVAVTRGECSSGGFSLVLSASPASGSAILDPLPILLAVSGAILVAISLTVALRRRRRGR